MKRLLSVLFVLQWLFCVRGQQCDPPAEVPNTKPVTRETYPDGTRVSYSCVLGYQMRGRNWIECNGGDWTKPLFTCERITCPWLDPPEHGSREFNRFAGETTEFSCDTGYRLVGADILTCYTDGGWRPETGPSCVVVRCPAQRYFAHGSMFQDTLDGEPDDYRSTIEYDCRYGYELVGPNRRTCQANGQWSGDTPYCKEIVCDDAAPLYNGELYYTDNKRLGTQVYFECNDDSELAIEHEYSADCQDDQTWSRPTNQCLRKATVGRLKNGKNQASGEVIVKNTDVKSGTMVRSNCEGQYELHRRTTGYVDRSFTNSRNNNGTWVPELPTCIAVRCVVPSSSCMVATYSNGTPLQRKAPSGTKVTFTPRSGYEFSDGTDTPMKKKCTKGAIEIPTCVPKNCVPEIVDNSYLFINGQHRRGAIAEVRHNSAIEVRCNAGYELYRNTYVNSFRTTCSLGRWGETPFAMCAEKRCLVPSSSCMVATYSNGTTVQRKSPSGTKVTFTPRSGYEFSDGTDTPKKKKCTKGDIEIPTCVPKNCAPEVVDNSYMLINGQPRRGAIAEVRHNSAIEVRCNAGYELYKKAYVNSFRTTCSLGGWSATPFAMCTGLRCDMRNTGFVVARDGAGTIVESKVAHGTEVTFSCPAGYDLRGTETSRCNKGQVTIPTCVPKNCAPEVVDNSYMLINGQPRRGAVAEVRHNSAIEVRCNAGYELYRNAYVNSFRTTCSFGSWSATPFAMCTELRCDMRNTGIVVARNEAGTIVESKVTHGTEVTFSCPAGYDLRGTETSRCNKGQVTIPTCVPMSCETEVVDNAVMLINGQRRRNAFNEARHNSEIEVRCNPGFELYRNAYKASFKSTCTLGRWSITPFATCIEKRCTLRNLGNVVARTETGMMVETKVAHGANITFSCPEGYDLRGQETSGCNKGHVTVPTCVPKPCPVEEMTNRYWKLNGNKLTATKVPDGTKITAHCVKGFELHKGVYTDSFSSTCTRGTWSETPFPSCRGQRCNVERPENSILYRSRKTTTLFKYRKAQHGVVLEVRCKNDYQLFDSANRALDHFNTSCSKGQWSRDFPSCKSTVCQDTMGVHLQVKSSTQKSWNYTHGTTVSVTCPDNFVSSLSETTCHYGEWDPPVSACERETSPATTTTTPKTATTSTTLETTVAAAVDASATSTSVAASHTSTVSGTSSSKVTSSVNDESHHNNEDTLSYIHTDENTENEGMGENSETEEHTTACRVPDLSKDGIQLYTIDDTNIEADEIPHGYVVKAVCNEIDYDGDYEGSESNLTCNNGHLKGDLPTDCKQGQNKECDSVENAIVSGGFILGFTVECKEGYQLTPNYELFSCLEGKWKPSVPKCVGESCTIPQYNGVVKNRKESHLFKGATVDYGETVIFSCPPGMAPQNAVKKCEAGSLGEFLCEKDCGTPPALVNGNIDTSEGTLVNATARYSCKSGYDLGSTTTRTCGEDGSWSTLVPQCTPKDCGPPEAPRHGDVYTNEGTRFGSTARYTCLAGYDISLPSERTCTSDGSWSGSVPTCSLKDCGEPPIPENGYVRFPDGTKLGAKAYYNCDQGYYVMGLTTRTCSTSGGWSARMPFCTEKAKCLIPESVQKNVYFNGQSMAKVNSMRHASIVTLKCQGGYLPARETLKCDDGQWQNNDTQQVQRLECVQARCFIPESVQQHVYGHSQPPGDVSYVQHAAIITLKCPDGSQPAEETYQCDSGQWRHRDTQSFQRPQCVQVFCDPPCHNGGRCMAGNRCDCQGRADGDRCERCVQTTSTSTLYPRWKNVEDRDLGSDRRTTLSSCFRRCHTEVQGCQGVYFSNLKRCWGLLNNPRNKTLNGQVFFTDISQRNSKGEIMFC